MAPLKLTSRQVGALYAGWQAGTQRTRELIVERPQIYLQAQATSAPPSPSQTERWLHELDALCGIARRARRTLEHGLLQQLLRQEREQVEHGFARMRSEVQRLLERFELESGHAG
jgi:hypothetical protein